MTDHVLGVDVATTKLALGWLADDDTISWHTHTTPNRLDPARRLVYWRRYLTEGAGVGFLDGVVTVAVEIPWAPSRSQRRASIFSFRRPVECISLRPVHRSRRRW